MVANGDIRSLSDVENVVSRTGVNGLFVICLISVVLSFLYRGYGCSGNFTKSSHVRWIFCYSEGVHF